MKTISPQLQTLLSSRQYYKAKLITITLANGTVLRYCTGDTNINSFNELRRYDISQWDTAVVSTVANQKGLDGKTNTAWTITATGAGNQSHIAALGYYSGSPDGTLPANLSGNLTMTVFARPSIPSTANYMAAIWCSQDLGPAATVIFNLAATGDATATYTQAGGTVVYARSTPWIGGFVKCIFTANLPAGITELYPEFGPFPTATASSFNTFLEPQFVQAGESLVASSPLLNPYVLNSFSAGGETGPYFEQTDKKIMGHWKIGTGSDSITLDILPGQATIGSIAFLTAARIGLFDGADVQIDYAFMGTYGTVSPGCAITTFRGRVAEVDIDRNIISMTVNDSRELLNQQMPRNLFAASCANTLFDASCTVDPNAFKENLTAQVGSVTTGLLTNSTAPDAVYDHGKLIWTSGTMTGLSFTVSHYDATTVPFTTILPVTPFPFNPQPGDTFTVYQGCDRTLDGGCAKFANQANFRGFPYTPAPETAV